MHVKEEREKEEKKKRERKTGVKGRGKRREEEIIKEKEINSFAKIYL